MRRSLIWSVGLHLLVLVLALVGLPRLWDSKPLPDTPIIVDVVKIDKKTKAEDTPKPKPLKKKVVKTPPPPEPPRARSATVPPPPPPPQLREKAAPQAEKVPVIKPKKKTKKKPKAKPKPKPKVKPITPPRQIVRARPRRRPPPSKDDFVRSVLRDVAPEKRAEKPKKTVKKETPRPAPAPKKTPVRRAPLDARATMTEIDAIRRQIEACWSIPAGARSAENLVVGIRVWVNPDGKVANAKILDRGRMGADPFFRSAAESAMRAVLNPRCSPLRFPPKKYDEFKVMVLYFNPKEATGL